MAINFSRSASQIVGQYYVFLRNGREGYREIHQRTLDVARYLAGEIGKAGPFDLLESAEHLPIVCWRLRDGADGSWTLYDLADRLRMHGWLVPAYPMPANIEGMDVQRLVLRQDFSMQLAARLVDDLRREVAVLGGHANAPTGSFDHSGRATR